MKPDKQGNDSPALPRRDRLRRVVILCRNFARNLAYYRTGQRPEYQPLLDPKHPRVNFWRVTNSNFIDICVLEWCKLFADHKNGKHHWSKIVSAPAAFKTSLLSHLGIGEDGLNHEVDAMKEYRDKFLAHLDFVLTMNIPVLDIAKTTVWFYHAHVIEYEAGPGDLVGLPLELDAGYLQSEAEACAVYQLDLGAKSGRMDQE
jgi:hypothetical protein